MIWLHLQLACLLAHLAQQVHVEIMLLADLGNIQPMAAQVSKTAGDWFTTLSTTGSAAGFASSAAQAVSTSSSATAVPAAGSQDSASASSASSGAATMATPSANVSSELPAPRQPVDPKPAPVAPGSGAGVCTAAVAAAASFPGVMATFGVPSVFGGYPSSQYAGTPTDYGSAASGEASAHYAVTKRPSGVYTLVSLAFDRHLLGSLCCDCFVNNDLLSISIGMSGKVC